MLFSIIVSVIGYFQSIIGSSLDTSFHTTSVPSSIDPLQVSCCHSNIRHLGVQPVFATLIALVSIKVKQYQEVELLLLHSMAKVDQVKPMLFPTLSGLQNGLYSKMADVAMVAAHLQRVY